MPRITKVYTRTGDDGTTSLGGGRRVPKDSARIDAYGTVDELNSAIGVALAEKLDSEIAAPLARIQNDLFHLGADLCILEEDKARVPAPRIEARHVEELDSRTSSCPAAPPARRRSTSLGLSAVAPSASSSRCPGTRRSVRTRSPT
jgi:ATP:cob(I)alamin adenosyltransferase